MKSGSQKKTILSRSKVILFMCVFIFGKLVSQEKKFDATTIAYTDYNSIVKILLFDSLAEKKTPQVSVGKTKSEKDGKQTHTKKDRTCLRAKSSHWNPR